MNVSNKKSRTKGKVSNISAGRLSGSKTLIVFLELSQKATPCRLKTRKKELRMN